MAGMSPFNNPLFLGFEHFENMLERASKGGADSYPPYNIEQIDETHLRITVAVAGFTEKDLSVTVEDNQLVICGIKPEQAEEKIYLHKGIATRQFKKSFVIADNLKVISANTENGLLNIDLEKTEPQVKIKHIKINSGN